MKNKILVIILAVVVVMLAVLVGWKIMIKKDNTEGNIAVENKENINPEENQENNNEEPQIKIWSGDSRSVAIMIDNVGDARPQAGINEAAIVYEVTVEGSLTRLLAVYKNVKDKTATIGPVRSARPVFLDYAMENGSIFVHFGYSNRAKEDIEKLKINNVNGLVASSPFWRTKEKKAPHNVLTSMEKILKYSEDKGYNLKESKRTVLNYVPEEVELEEGEVANSINIPYTGTYKVSYKYNEETKLYERYVNNSVQKDWVTNDVRTTKNIIVTYANNYTTDEEPGAGRQEVENIGDLKGYYLTDGKIIKIICSKASRSAQTIYKNENGEEIKVNDGNTYVQIVPLKTEVTYE